MFQRLFHPLQQVVDRLPGHLHLFGDFRQGIIFTEIQLQALLLLFRQQGAVHLVQAAETDPVIKIIGCNSVSSIPFYVNMSIIHG